jgi:hypothetical protein
MPSGVLFFKGRARKFRSTHNFTIHTGGSMLKGRTIESLTTEIDRQYKSKHDFLFPTSFLAFTLAGEITNKKDKTSKSFPLTNYAHRQVSSYVGIPHQYYEKMLAEQPDLLAANVNRWLESKKPGSKRLLRTLDGKARAFLSDSYLPIDNHDLVGALLPQIVESGCQIVSAEITERKLYIKALTPKITGEVKVGDRVQAGLIIQNSEVGCGKIEISPLVYRLVCSNGMIINDLVQSRHHLGRKIHDDEIEANGIYSRETIMADIRAFLLKARDSVKAALDQSVFSKIVNKMRDATEQKIENVEEAIEEITNRYSFSDEENKLITGNMFDGGDTSRYGLVNAVTAAAHQITDYDRSVEIERIGGEILYLN